jgi:hypothetical protein
MNDGDAVSQLFFLGLFMAPVLGLAVYLFIKYFDLVKQGCGYIILWTLIGLLVLGVIVGLFIGLLHLVK